MATSIEERTQEYKREEEKINAQRADQFKKLPKAVVEGIEQIQRLRGTISVTQQGKLYIVKSKIARVIFNENGKPLSNDGILSGSDYYASRYSMPKDLNGVVQLDNTVMHTLTFISENGEYLVKDMQYPVTYKHTDSKRLYSDIVRLNPEFVRYIDSSLFDMQYFLKLFDIIYNDYVSRINDKKVLRSDYYKLLGEYQRLAMVLRDKSREYIAEEAKYLSNEEKEKLLERLNEIYLMYTSTNPWGV